MGIEGMGYQVTLTEPLTYRIRNVKHTIPAGTKVSVIKIDDGVLFIEHKGERFTVRKEKTSWKETFN